MQSPTDQYQQNHVLTARPEQLLIQTYDGSIRFLRAAAAAMTKKDLSAQNDSILRAQQLLLYHEANPELASNLESIYSYLLERLTWANVNDDTAPVEEALSLLGDLRSAWCEALAGLQSGAVEPAGVAV